MNILNHLNRSEVSIPILLTISILTITLPYGFPLFGFLVMLFALLKVLTGKFKIRINTGFLFFFACSLLYFLGVLWNDGTIYDRNKIEITNILSFFLFWVLLSDLKKENYKTLIDNFSKMAVALCFFVSLYSLYKFYLLLNGTYIDWIFITDRYPSGTSLTRDYNMFSFGLFAGSIMAIYLLGKTSKLMPSFYYLMTTLLCFVSILLAGSRRGWVVIVILSALLIYKLFRYLLKKNNHRKVLKISIILSYIGVFVISISILFGANFSKITDGSNVSYELSKLQNRFNSLQSDPDSAFSQRSDRWEYAVELLGENNFLQLSLGTGFDYLPKYAQKFAPDISEDYPHNPVISAALYSGMIGALFLISLIVWSIYKGFANWKTLGFYFMTVFGISWFYIFISTNSIFAVKLFVMLLLIVISVPNTKPKPQPQTIYTKQTA